MKWSNDLPCALQMVIQGFGTCDRFVEERVGEAIQLRIYQQRCIHSRFHAYQLLRGCCALAECSGNLF